MLINVVYVISQQRREPVLPILHATKLHTLPTEDPSGAVIQPTGTGLHQPPVTPPKTHMTVPQPPLVQYPMPTEKKIGMDTYNPESVMLSDPGYPVSVERKVGVGVDVYPTENSLVTLQPLSLLRAAMMCESGPLDPEAESRAQNIESGRM